MRSEWITSTIDDICKLVTDGAHNSPKSVDNGYYMASVKDFTAYGFDFSNCRKISEADYLKLKKQGCVPESGDILVGKDGARYFEDVIIYRQKEQPALLSSIAILRVDDTKVTSEFLYYTLKSPAVKKDVRDNYGSGSAIPRIVLKDFKRMPISFPSLKEQKKITNICELLDEKIQLNNRINNNLPPHPCNARIAAIAAQTDILANGCLHTDGKVSGRGGNEETAKQFSSLSMA